MSKRYAQVLAITFAALAATQNEASSTAIWLAAEDPITVQQFAVGSSVDYMKLFEGGEDWKITAQHTNVLKIYNQFPHAPAEMQRAVYSWAKANGVAIALEDGILPTASPFMCGWGVEGYSGSTAWNIQTMQNHGAEVAYLAMGQPLYHGVQSTLPNTCQDSVKTIAQQAATRARELKKKFPNLKIGDMEPIPWTKDIPKFLDYYELYAGFPLDFFHAEILQFDGWQDSLRSLRHELDERGIEYGVLYNGSWKDCLSGGNLAWTSAAIDLFRQVEADPTIAPNTAVFQTWNKCPTHLLPETTPGTLTNVVYTYLHEYGHINSDPLVYPPEMDPVSTTNVNEPGRWMFAVFLMILIMVFQFRGKATVDREPTSLDAVG